MTMTLIETKTLVSAAAQIEFTSIPQTFTDLRIVFSLRSSLAVGRTQGFVRFNGVSTGYSERILIGSEASVSSSTGGTTELTFNFVNSANSTPNTFSNTEVYIPNYAGTTNKSISTDSVIQTMSGDFALAIVAGLFANTAAITSFSITAFSSANFVVGSTISLYGILKGSDGIVTTS